MHEDDELVHPYGDDRRWRESLYFNWHDAGGKIAGITTIGIRPNEHCYEGFAVLFLGRQVLFYHTQGALDPAYGLYAVPGLAFQPVVPWQRWQMQFRAPFATLLGSGAVSPPTTPVEGTLSFDAVNPAYLFPEEGLVAMGIAAGHYEQCGHVRGSIAVGTETIAVRGLGFRDHSWGVRDLQQAASIVGLLAQFTGDLAVNVAWEEVGGQGVAIGYVWNHGQNNPITAVHIAVEMDAQGWPTGAAAQIDAAGMSPLQLRANVQAVMPIVLQQGPTTLRWCECFSRFDAGGPVPGYGMLETTHLV